MEREKLDFHYPSGYTDLEGAYNRLFCVKWADNEKLSRLFAPHRRAGAFLLQNHGAMIEGCGAWLVRTMDQQVGRQADARFRLG